MTPAAVPAGRSAPLPAEPRAATPRREGRVVKTLLGEVEIDLGRRDGVRFGENIELSLLTTE